MIDDMKAQLDAEFDSNHISEQEYKTRLGHLVLTVRILSINEDKKND
jgi:hypothetical protein